LKQIKQWPQWGQYMYNEKLLSIAKEKSNQIVACSSKDQAVMVTGSLSKGQADKSYDIDMIVY
jgi:predicted nucleotidyltransferase